MPQTGIITLKIYAFGRSAADTFVDYMNAKNDMSCRAAAHKTGDEQFMIATKALRHEVERIRR